MGVYFLLQMGPNRHWNKCLIKRDKRAWWQWLQTVVAVATEMIVVTVVTAVTDVTENGNSDSGDSDSKPNTWWLVCRWYRRCTS